MSATNQAEQTALTLPQRAAVALGESANEAKLRELVAKSSGILAVTNADGRDEAHRAGMVLLKTRTGITAKGKVAREDATAFSRAVIAMEKDLIGIIEPEETRVLALRDKWDEQIAAEKAAKVAAERARVEAIQSDIAAIRDTAMGVAGKPSGVIAAAIDVLEEIEPSEARFAEYAADAFKVISDTIDKLVEMLESAKASEAAAAAAEEARLAEIARIEAERQELAKQRAEQAEAARLAKIESDRIAAEQAAEARRLREVAAEQDRQREAEVAKLRAEQEERDRVQADVKRQLEAQQATLAAQQKAFAEEQAAAAKREEERIAAEVLRQQVEVDHAEAIEMNATLDAAIARIEPVETFHQPSECARLQACADQHLADNLPPPESCTVRDAFIDAAIDPDYPDDNDILDIMLEQFGLEAAEAIERLAKFDFVAARAKLEVA